MPWCPKCKAEYREGFTTCSDCNVTLVSELQLDPKEDYGQEDYDKEAFLMSVTSDLEAQSIEALLLANRIPVLKKYSEAGGYLKVYMGGTSFGTDLYVPSRLLHKAQEIINAQNGLEIEEFEQIEGIITPEKKYTSDIEVTSQKQQNKNQRGLRLLTIFIFLLISILVVWTIIRHVFS